MSKHLILFTNYLIMKCVPQNMFERSEEILIQSSILIVINNKVFSRFGIFSQKKKVNSVGYNVLVISI